MSRTRGLRDYSLKEEVHVDLFWACSRWNCLLPFGCRLSLYQSSDTKKHLVLHGASHRNAEYFGNLPFARDLVDYSDYASVIRLVTTEPSERSATLVKVNPHDNVNSADYPNRRDDNQCYENVLRLTFKSPPSDYVGFRPPHLAPPPELLMSFQTADAQEKWATVLQEFIPTMYRSQHNTFNTALYHYTTALPAILKSKQLRASTVGLFGAGVYFMTHPPDCGREFLQDVAYDQTGQQFAARVEIGYIKVERATLEHYLQTRGMKLYGPLDTGDGAHYKTCWSKPPWDRVLPPVELDQITYTNGVLEVPRPPAQPEWLLEHWRNRARDKQATQPSWARYTPRKGWGCPPSPKTE
eukprot:TRINITY_DN105474_c0_g1_i1.p1 TRINITY_DN105474_c0_g1~~TRINITY_DN105474_c0_g1_i1.p1  ORF type:complete len:370 (-),score=7.05 TRINITY_DN105474_c0_g1_i1:8-1069(-)